MYSLFLPNTKKLIANQKNNSVLIRGWTELYSPSVQHSKKAKWPQTIPKFATACSK